MNAQLDLFAGTLPERPYCTDQLGSLVIRQKAEAIKKRYIQPNSPWDIRWMPYDIDRETAHYDWQDRSVAAPNIVCTNRDNGHSHLLYALAVPVHSNFNSRSRKHPLRYAASIDIAMIKELDADPGYAKLICKNPLNKHWIVETFQTAPYDLAWLADYLELENTDTRRNLPQVGLGRNCTLFDNLRYWSYRAIRRTWLDLPGMWTYDRWLACVLTKAASYNNFLIPLPFTEIKSISKSVARYTWYNTNPEGFRKWGDNRRQKSIETRQAKAEQTRKRILEAKEQHPRASQRELAKLTGVSVGTVNTALKQC